MEALRFLFLGIVQGATEFIPVSSSAHLVLVPWLAGWPPTGLLFDTVVHWGSLVGVLVYFRRDVGRLIVAWLGSIRSRRIDGSSGIEAKLAWLIVLGTMPAAIMGVLWKDFFSALFDSPTKVAGLLLVTGAVISLSERVGRRDRDIASMSAPDALLVGLAQGLAIAPGISRSGFTIAAGLFRGLRREDAARYSFLLSIPIILGAGVSQVTELSLADLAQRWLAFSLGFAGAALSGFLCIAFLLAFLRSRRLYPFAVYCWLFGGFCLLLVYLGYGS